MLISLGSCRGKITFVPVSAPDTLIGTSNLKPIFMEKTLVLLKPGSLQRGIVGEIISRFEKKGLKLVGIKMLHMTDELLDEHYAHLREKSFFPSLKAMMKTGPIIACCLEGVEAVNVVRSMTGYTNSRKANPGTIRGDYGMSNQHNIIHSSDSHDAAKTEMERFFRPEEIFDYETSLLHYLYGKDEL